MKLTRFPRLTLSTAFRYISAASMITVAASARGQTSDLPTVQEVLRERFPDFLSRLRGEKSSPAKARLVDNFIAHLRNHGRPLVEDTTVHFVYQGTSRQVTVPSDLNSWNATADTMVRIEGTDLFYLSKNVHRAARFEYKFVVDSSWILDPLNRQQAIGGYGPNSEVRMSAYVPPEEILPRKDSAHGSIDTIFFRSKVLGRTHPVFVYLPKEYKHSSRTYPSIWVTDGGEYLSLALMNNVLDNMIADGRIEPVVGVFVDPRTDPRDSGTSMRMHDYTMSDTFAKALTVELLPHLLRKYRISTAPEQTAIMGASLGGLISTYIAYTKPEVFGLAAAQSPSFWWNNDTIIHLVRTGKTKKIRFYIDTGTIADALAESRRMKAALETKGYELSYAEYPEGHNWVNWRARLDDILLYFWGKK